MMLSGKRRKELSAGYRLTTNNRMEYLAVIKALKAIRKKDDVEIVVHSDSRLLVDTMTKGWIEKWRRNGWVKSDKKIAKNKDLLKQLYELKQELNVRFKWVKAHAGLEENEGCDHLAREAAMGKKLLVDKEYERARKYGAEPAIPMPEARKPQAASDEFKVEKAKSGVAIMNLKTGESITVTNKQIDEFKSKVAMIQG